MTIIELRQYTMHPGQRDVLIDIFDREFVAGQEEAGMQIIGQFRDVDDPDRFVWLRSFPDMAERARSLQAFYYGPVWQAHREEANPTMIDSDNVLLLRPARPGSGFGLPTGDRPGIATTVLPTAQVLATIYHLPAPVDEKFIRFFEDRITPAMVEAGATPFAYLETEPAVNTWPTLPVRTGEHVFVWFARFENPAQLSDHLDRLARSDRWNEQVLPKLSTQLTTAPERLRLTPTARSALR